MSRSGLDMKMCFKNKGEFRNGGFPQGALDIDFFIYKEYNAGEVHREVRSRGLCSPWWRASPKRECVMKTVLRQVAWAVAVIALVLSFVACGGSPAAPGPVVVPPPGGTLVVSPMVVSLPSAGGTEQLAVSGEGSWTASTAAGWLSVSPASGSGAGSVTVTAQLNNGSTRTTTVVVGGRSVSVSQAAAPISGPTLAPPPPGVSAAKWEVGFSMDGKLRRPDAGITIHFDVSALPQEGRDMFAARAAVATATMAGKLFFDTTPDGTGITFPVKVTDAPIQCGSVLLTVGACTFASPDSSGRIVGGRVEFTHVQWILQGPTAVLHEIYRTMGITRSATEGIMAAPPTTQTATAEDVAMFLGRFDYPLLAQYAAQ